MRADVAAKYIYSHLLKAIKDNEQGTIADTDSEFLHDFRVAVRRPRAGLSQLNPYLTHIINIHLKTIPCALKNLRVALHLKNSV
jgi:CHAD domain-containing protein